MASLHTIGRTATTIGANDQGATVVTYHSTPVVTFTHDTIVLDHGNYRTMTTKTRMNQASNQFKLGYQVFQRDYAWFVQTEAGTFPFDGRTLCIDRKTMEPIPSASIEADD